MWPSPPTPNWSDSTSRGWGRKQSLSWRCWAGSTAGPPGSPSKPSDDRRTGSTDGCRLGRPSPPEFVEHLAGVFNHLAVGMGDLNRHPPLGDRLVGLGPGAGVVLGGGQPADGSPGPGPEDRPQHGREHQADLGEGNRKQCPEDASYDRPDRAPDQGRLGQVGEQMAFGVVAAALLVDSAGEVYRVSRH